MGGPHRSRLRLEKQRRPYRRFEVGQRVLDARQKRGRSLDLKIDRCRNCLHFLPKNERCGLDQHYTTADGSCALHERGSEIDL